MGTSQSFPIMFSPAVRKILKQHVGKLGNSESEIIKNIVLSYFKEKAPMARSKTSKRKVGG